MKKLKTPILRNLMCNALSVVNITRNVKSYLTYLTQANNWNTWADKEVF